MSKQKNFTSIKNSLTRNEAFIMGRGSQGKSMTALMIMANTPNSVVYCASESSEKDMLARAKSLGITINTKVYAGNNK